MTEIVIPTITNEEFIKQLFQLLGGVSGASSLGIVIITVQLIMKYLGTPWAESLPANQGAYKLVVFMLCTLILGVASQVANGMEILPALLQSGNLAALMVFVNQIYKQFFVKKD